jgi:RimJ/RimL family protein N-acetyltransferase
VLDTPRLTTARLVLEPLTIAAAPEMVTVLSDPSLYRHIGGAPPDVSALAAQYALQANLQSPDGTSRWLNWIVRRAQRVAGRLGFVATSQFVGRETVWERR